MTEPDKRVKKKKKRTGAAPAPHYSEPLRPITSAHRPAAAERWGTGAVIAGFLVCLGLGGATGYLFSRPGAATTATKDSASTSQPAAPGGGEKAPAQQQPGAKGQPPAKPPQPGAYIPLASWTPVEGPAVAKVTIVEFSDYQ